MKKSTIWTLVIALLLLVAGFALTGAGIVSSYRSVTYDLGFGYYRTMTYANTMQSHLLRVFGGMSFILGIAGMLTFIYLAIANPKEKNVKPSAKVRTHSERVKDAEEAAVKEDVKAEPVSKAPEAPSAEAAVDSEASAEDDK